MLTIFTYGLSINEKDAYEALRTHFSGEWDDEATSLRRSKALKI